MVERGWEGGRDREGKVDRWGGRGRWAVVVAPPRVHAGRFVVSGYRQISGRYLSDLQLMKRENVRGEAVKSLISV